MSALVRVTGRSAMVRLAQLLVGVLLGWAALAKLADIPALALDIHHFRLLPLAAENLLAMVLPWIELTAALSLLLGIRPRAGAAVAAGLMVVFTAAVAIALARGLSIACGCFGVADATRVGTAKLVENALILAVATVAVLRPRPVADP